MSESTRRELASHITDIVHRLSRKYELQHSVHEFTSFTITAHISNIHDIMHITLPQFPLTSSTLQQQPLGGMGERSHPQQQPVYNLSDIDQIIIDELRGSRTSTELTIKLDILHGESWDVCEVHKWDITLDPTAQTPQSIQLELVYSQSD